MADAPLPVRVAPVTPALDDAVRALRVQPGQYGFVGDIAQVLVECERDADSEPMAILLGDVVVGFYRLDFSPVVVGGKSLGTAAVALRSLMIDRGRQGQGIGRRAMAACCEDLHRRHPGRKLLALTVNCANAAALALYRESGFVDTGELYFGGPSGPQRILLRRLDAAAVGE